MATGKSDKASGIFFRSVESHKSAKFLKRNLPCSQNRLQYE